MKANIKLILAVIALVVALALTWYLIQVQNRKKLMGKLEHIKHLFGSILRQKTIRNDPAGSGRYGAERDPDDPKDKHKGVDLLATPGESVYSPIDGKVVRSGYAYSGDYKYKLLVVVGEGEFDGYMAKLLYVEPLPGIVGTNVCAGDEIGLAQAISQKYPGQGMKDHIHAELYVDPVWNPATGRYNGKLIDPEPYYLA